MSAACRRNAARRRRGLRVLGTAFGLLAAFGCRLQGPPIVPAPWTFAEQRAAILEIAPLGTSRTRAIERWQAAGIDGAFGSNDSIWYCDAWRRPDGALWQLGIAALFDEQGRLYETRVADAQTSVIPSGEVQAQPAAHSP